MTITSGGWQGGSPIEPASARFAAMTDYGRIPPGYAPDWMLIEAMRVRVHGELTRQTEDELRRQWFEASRRLKLALEEGLLVLYRASPDAEMVAVPQAHWRQVEFNLSTLPLRWMLWNEPGVFGERLFIPNVELEDYNLVKYVWLNEAELALPDGKPLLHPGGRPRSSDEWLFSFDLLFPDGKPGLSWPQIARRIGENLGVSDVNPETLAKAVNRRLGRDAPGKKPKRASK